VEADEDSSELGRKAIAKKSRKQRCRRRHRGQRKDSLYHRRHQLRPRPRSKNRCRSLQPEVPARRSRALAIVAEVGAEVVTGSTRMKAGTAQKMILNMLSTGAMARLGYVYGNLMVNLRPKNAKLLERGVSILEKTAGLNHQAARKLLAAAGGRIPVALVMAKANVSQARAEAALRESKGQAPRISGQAPLG
jgi:N-acetylmuramic acid 6-phosphate etherase